MIPGLSASTSVYELSLCLLAGTFVLYALVLRMLLPLIGRRRLWILPLIGAVLLVTAAVLHGFTEIVLVPQIPQDASIYKESMKLRTASLACLSGCGLLATVTAWLYYHRMAE